MMLSAFDFKVISIADRKAATIALANRLDPLLGKIENLRSGECMRRMSKPLREALQGKSDAALVLSIPHLIQHEEACDLDPSNVDQMLAASWQSFWDHVAWKSFLSLTGCVLVPDTTDSFTSLGGCISLLEGGIANPEAFHFNRRPQDPLLGNDGRGLREVRNGIAGELSTKIISLLGSVGIRAKL